MRQTTHTTQVFTLFGGGYVPEAHGRGPALDDERKAHGARWTAAVCAVLIAATTTAGALTAAKRNYPQMPKLWLQPAPTILMNLPDVVSVEEALY